MREEGKTLLSLFGYYYHFFAAVTSKAGKIV
jgi:hypothetical protein